MRPSQVRLAGGFPNDASVLRLITVVCVEQHDDWTASDRRYLSSESMALLKATGPEDETNARSASLMAMDNHRSVEDAVVQVTPLSGT